ncbi:MAG TPA: hypothetical protein QGG59_01780 [Planctomycetota bacterium]|jgi:hypothetical protein|nr:hypothetical protein [Planctomycetota bacterium]HJM38824.1 hypothetical protein [Planctomycetota bacterium]|tara:strand:+ start:10928 stop:12334 length:1407 start_codon:yes stop_codon:yes gene_type:complete
MSFSPFLLVAFLAQAVPGELEIDLAGEDPSLRLMAAAELAASPDGSIDAWILKEASRGTATRQRALLFAATLRGTSACLDFLEERAFQRGRVEADRAWALLLYGAFHPHALKEPEAAFKKAKSIFERDCFLAGLLKNANRIPSLQSLGSRKGSRLKSHESLLFLLDALAERKSLLPTLASTHSARLLASHLPKAKGLGDKEVEQAEAASLESWLVAARREPARSLQETRQIPSGIGEGSLALLLYEAAPSERKEVMEFLRDALVGGRQSAWLWGAAGDLSLSLLPPQLQEPLHDYQVAGLLRLCLSNPIQGEREVEAYQTLARARIQGSQSLGVDWPAAVLLAISPQQKDLTFLRKLTEESLGEDSARALPIWHLASGRVASGAARQTLLASWARELGAGWHGYLDSEGPRWTAYFLLSGTQAAEERLELRVELPAYKRKHDHSQGHGLYEDIAELLFSGHYFWGLPK